MKYIDRVYGEYEITEPVILELINSPSLQRLKDIDSAGYYKPFFPGEIRTRFNHSVGVFILLKKYNAPLEEQIAGLIHDVSHSAFSHCIDYVLNSSEEQEQNHQDNVFENYIKKTEIPEIIKKYELNSEYIINDKNFPLKEKKLPDLCADRIDYSLRDALALGEINSKGIEYFLENLRAERQVWFFKNFESSKRYANFFLKLNQKYYSGLASAIMYQTVSDYLKHALETGYIREGDLYTTDKIVLKKIKKFLNKDDKLKLLWDRINRRVGTNNNLNNYDIKVLCKSRIVDPLFEDNGRLIRLSDADLNWKDIIKRELKPKQYFLKFER